MGIKHGEVLKSFSCQSPLETAKVTILSNTDTKPEEEKKERKKIGSKPKNKDQSDSIVDYITMKQESASPDRSRKINQSHL